LAFPEPGQGAPRRLVLDRARLRTAGRALDRAPRGGSPQRKRTRRWRLQLSALERIFEAPGRPWTSEALELQRPQAKIWSQSPALSSCARSLAFLNLGDPRAEQRLALADRYAPELAAVLESASQAQLRATLALHDLLAEFERELAPALLVLRGDAPRLARPGAPALKHLESRLKRLTLRKPGAEPLPPASEPARAPLLLAQRFLQLHGQPRGERRKSVRALAALPPFDHARRRDFWDREAALDREVRVLEVRARHGRVRKLALARLEARLRALRPDAPLAYLDLSALEQVDALARDPSTMELLLKHAEPLPLASRKAWFSGWRPLLRDSRRERALRAIPRVGRWLGRSSRLPLTLRLDVLSRLEIASGASGVDVQRNLASLDAYLEAVRGLSAPQLPPPLLWHAGVRAAAKRREPAASWGRALAELLFRAPKAWEQIENRNYGALQILAKTAGSDPERLASLLAVLEEADLDGSGEGHLEELVDALLLAHPERGRALAYELLTHESLRDLARLGLGVEAYRELRGFPLALATPSPSLRAPSWVSAYPRQLRGLLRAIHAVAPRPQTAVSRALRSEFPGPASLQAEISALRRKVRAEGDRGGRYQRLQTLERRLATHSTPEPSRVRRARRRLEDRLRRARLNHLEGALLDALQGAFQAVVPGLPRAWLEDGRQRKLLLHAALLDEEAMRPQAWRLLRRRLASPLNGAPWDLRELGPNAWFVNQLQARGLHLTPWLEGTQVSVYPAPGGCVTLSLESDPLEVLRMGEHFETCLSPNDINYYSAISNALDVNKRVLYARDLEGRVVGRCLLALGDQGGILAHHPYAHEASLGFDRLVSDYVRELAGRIGTQPVASERISLLVAEEWYDDTQVDVCETEAFLRDGASEFRQALPTLDPYLLPARLRSACGGPPSARVVEGLLELPEFARRPELALGLLGSTRGLRPSSRLTLAILTRRAGQPAAGEDLLPSLTRRPGREPEHLRLLAEELVARGKPGPALRLTRRHGGLPDLERWARGALCRPAKPLETKNLKC